MIIFAIIVCAVIGIVCAFLAGVGLAVPVPDRGGDNTRASAIFMACGIALLTVAIVLALGVEP